MSPSLMSTKIVVTGKAFSFSRHGTVHDADRRDLAQGDLPAAYGGHHHLLQLLDVVTQFARVTDLTA